MVDPCRALSDSHDQFRSLQISVVAEGRRVNGMASVPDAPWRLSGEAILGLCRRRSVGRSAALPGTLRPLAGPALMFAARYTDSPVGPYLELGIAEPARLGLRPGWCVTTMAVTSTDSRVAGRASWGFPKELATRVWDGDAAEREVRWEERGLVLRARASGPSLPFIGPLRSLQRRGDGPVVVPGHLWGLARFARLELKVSADDDLAWADGPHPGLSLSGTRFVVQVARHPHGLFSTLRAPLRAAEGTAAVGSFAPAPRGPKAEALR